MEYQKIIDLLYGTTNETSKFRTKNSVEKKDDLHGTYNSNSQIKLKATIVKSSWYYYSDTYILPSWTKIVTGAGDDAAARKVDK